MPAAAHLVFVIQHPSPLGNQAPAPWARMFLWATDHSGKLMRLRETLLGTCVPNLACSLAGYFVHDAHGPDNPKERI